MTNASNTMKPNIVLVRWGKRLLIVPPILMAVGILIFLTQNRAAPSERTESETSRALSVIAAPKLDIQPRVVGFGTAEYARKWRAVSQVTGRIKQIHPELHPGAIIRAGDVLLKIDDADYRSAVDELAAFIEQKEAEISQLEQTKTNYDKTLVIERSALSVVEGELQRAEALLARKVESQSSIDATQLTVIAQQKVVQDLENSKALIEPQIKALRASIRQSKVQREKAERDITRAEIRAPFTMRVGEVDLEADQFIGTNEMLFEGFSFSDMEIEVQLSMQDVPRLLAAPPANRPPPAEMSMEIMRSIFRVTPTVEVSGGETNAVYEGRFLRVREVVDTQTRQIGIVIGVTNKPRIENGRPRPPVLEGAFCKVTLRGESLGERIVVPRSALHGSTVYVVDQQNRLAEREVKLEFTQEDVAVIASGLQAGERVIVSDPSPAVEAMLIEPVEDTELELHLRKAVQDHE